VTATGETELASVGQHVVFENDRVRVWHIALAPGETQPLHHHDLPYLVIAVQGARNLIRTVDGNQIPADEPTGGVVFRTPGATHTLTNTGDTTYMARIVELKPDHSGA
jgi:quercetin dioxygenase-like cupin family protein